MPNQEQGKRENVPMEKEGEKLNQGHQQDIGRKRSDIGQGGGQGQGQQDREQQNPNRVREGKLNEDKNLKQNDEEEQKKESA